MFDKSNLEKLYVHDGLSVMDISLKFECSVHKVIYWMDKHDIKRRTISDAIYLKRNPAGDPFTVAPVTTKAEAELYGLGLGLYWGEGNKANKHSIRLGNTDPALLRAFMRFLIEMYGVRKDRLKFTLQIFSDINPQEALDYWVRQLDVTREQFYRPTVTISGSLGTYRKKSKYGVVTVNFHNKKLRDILVGSLPP